MKSGKFVKQIRILKRVIIYIYKASVLLFFLQILSIVLVGISPVFSVWATRLLINNIALASSGIDTNFIRILTIYGIINMLLYVSKSLNSYIQSKLQILVERKTSQDILEKCSTLSLKDFENSETYNLISKADEMGSFKVLGIYQKLLSIFSQVLSIASVSILILSWSSLFFLVIFIVPILSYIVNSKLNYENYCIRMDRVGDERKISYFKYLLTNDIACKEIIAYNTGKFFTNSFSKLKEKIAKQDINMLKKRTFLNLILNIFDELINLAVIFSVVLMTASGKLKIGDSVALIESLNIIQVNVALLLSGVSELTKEMFYVENFFALLDINNENEKLGKINLEDINDIEFVNVSFKYDNTENYALKNINLKIKRGEKVAVMGENG